MRYIHKLTNQLLIINAIILSRCLYKPKFYGVNLNMDEPDEIWTIADPFDSLLFQNWSDNQVALFVNSLIGTTEPQICEALAPNKGRNEYFRDNLLQETIHNFHNAPNLCSKYKLCQVNVLDLFDIID